MPESQDNNITRVVVTGINMPFGAMVSFLIKLVFAAIPAAIIVNIIIYGVILFVISAVGVGIGGMGGMMR